jgi:hypothetical protein
MLIILLQNVFCVVSVHHVVVHCGVHHVVDVHYVVVHCGVHHVVIGVHCIVGGHHFC